MSIRIPSAEPQEPACGACGGNTTFTDEWFVCEDCRLGFDANSLSPEFIYHDDSPCGEPCTNRWHGPGKLNARMEFTCYPCSLPSGHTSLHWFGCEPHFIQQEEET